MANLFMLYKVRQMDGYRFEKNLDNGEFGKVVLLHDVVSQRKVVGKLVPKPAEGESTIWWQLSHQNLMPLFDIVRLDDEAKMFVMPLMKCTLNEIINDKEFYSDVHCWYRKKSYIKDAMNGLTYLHKRGFCLLNLSERNILVTDSEDIAVLSNFSCLTKADGATKESFEVRDICIPPEIGSLKHTYPFDAIAAEMWVCGLTILQVFTRQMLFNCYVDSKLCEKDIYSAISQQLTPQNICLAIQNANPASHIPVHVEDGFIQFVSRFLTYNPQLRINAYAAMQHPFLICLNDPDHEQPTVESDQEDKIGDSNSSSQENLHSPSPTDVAQIKDQTVPVSNNFGANIRGKIKEIKGNLHLKSLLPEDQTSDANENSKLASVIAPVDTSNKCSNEPNGEELLRFFESNDQSSFDHSRENTRCSSWPDQTSPIKSHHTFETQCERLKQEKSASCDFILSENTPESCVRDEEHKSEECFKNYSFSETHEELLGNFNPSSQQNIINQRLAEAIVPSLDLYLKDFEEYDKKGMSYAFQDTLSPLPLSPYSDEDDTDLKFEGKIFHPKPTKLSPVCRNGHYTEITKNSDETHPVHDSSGESRCSLNDRENKSISPVPISDPVVKAERVAKTGNEVTGDVSLKECTDDTQELPQSTNIWLKVNDRKAIPQPLESADLHEQAKGIENTPETQEDDGVDNDLNVLKKAEQIPRDIVTNVEKRIVFKGYSQPPSPVFTAPKTKQNVVHCPPIPRFVPKQIHKYEKLDSEDEVCIDRKEEILDIRPYADYPARESVNSFRGFEDLSKRLMSETSPTETFRIASDDDFQKKPRKKGLRWFCSMFKSKKSRRKRKGKK